MIFNRKIAVKMVENWLFIKYLMILRLFGTIYIQNFQIYEYEPYKNNFWDDWRLCLFLTWFIPLQTKNSQNFWISNDKFLILPKINQNLPKNHKQGEKNHFQITLERSKLCSSWGTVTLAFRKSLKTPRMEMRFSQHSGELGI